MKTYEKFIASNLFRKRKKLPQEVIDLSNVVYDFMKQHITYGYDVYIKEIKPEDKKDDNRIYISFDPNTLDGTYNFVNLYWNSNTNLLSFFILSQPRNKELKNIQEFLELILKNYSEKWVSPRWDVSFSINLDNIPEIIEKLKSEDFDVFINANNYNI